MRRLQACLGDQARSPGEHQCLLRGLPGACDKQIAEGGVGFVRTRVRQCDLERRQQFELHGALAQVVQFDLAELDVVLRAYPDRRQGM